MPKQSGFHFVTFQLFCQALPDQSHQVPAVVSSAQPLPLANSWDGAGLGAECVPEQPSGVSQCTKVYIQNDT